MHPLESQENEYRKPMIKSITTSPNTPSYTNLYVGSEVTSSHIDKYLTNIGGKGVTWRHSFFDKIISIKLPPNWKGLSICQYDGRVTLTSMLMFVTQMSHYTSEDTMLYCVFTNIIERTRVELVYSSSTMLYY